ncbi:cold-shock protein [Tenacibaculum sp. C7A-26P2]|uniref:cold-shock protein n=1 Tax=Tenacibaculum sp. C7A-26P2 TaxID=3447504 RepID=UPI003F8330F9
MQEGIVKFFNDSKGYGFITSSETGKDIFVHDSGLIDNITKNNKVRFETQRGKKGLNAINVEVIEKSFDEARDTFR